MKIFDQMKRKLAEKLPQTAEAIERAQQARKVPRRNPKLLLRPLLFGGRGKIHLGSGKLAWDAGSKKAGRRGGMADTEDWGERVGQRG